MNDPKSALKSYQLSLTWNHRLATLDPRNSNFQEHAALVWTGIARASQKLGRSKVALKKYTQAISVLERMSKADLAQLPLQEELASALYGRGTLRANLSNHDGAEDDLRRAFAFRGAVEKKKPLDLENHASLAEIAMALGDLKRSEISRSDTSASRQQACNWYQQASMHWHVLRDRHYLYGQYTEESNATAREVARCAEIRHS